MPKGLELMFTSLLENLNLHGWQIFEENKKYVTLRIRFQQDQGQSAMSPLPQTFKKVSSNQAKRNQSRAKKHFERTNVVTRSKKLSEIERPRENSEFSQCEELFQMTDSPAMLSASHAVNTTPEIEPLIAFSPDPLHTSPDSHVSISTQTMQDITSDCVPKLDIINYDY